MCAMIPTFRMRFISDTRGFADDLVPGADWLLKYRTVSPGHLWLIISSCHLTCIFMCITQRGNRLPGIIIFPSISSGWRKLKSKKKWKNNKKAMNACVCRQLVRNEWHMCVSGDLFHRSLDSRSSHLFPLLWTHLLLSSSSLRLLSFYSRSLLFYWYVPRFCPSLQIASLALFLTGSTVVSQLYSTAWC